MVDEAIGGGGTSDSVRSSVSFTSAEVERITLTGAANIDATYTGSLSAYLAGNDGNNILTSAGGADSLHGGVGNDVLYGGDGKDSLYGGAGFDYMRGGLGDDTYFVDSIYDMVDEDIGGGGTNDTVNSSVSFASATIENVILTGTADINATLSGGLRNIVSGNDGNNILSSGDAGLDNLYGGAGDDTLYSGGGIDSLFGGPGNDILIGGAGYDFLFGGDGNDIYYVDFAGDYVTESPTIAGGTADYIYSSVSLTTFEGVEGLLLLGSSDLTATGLDGQVDILIGNSGNNIFDGRGNYDYMAGGLGNDTYYVDNAYDTTDELNGGGGASDAVFSSVSFTAASGIELLYLYGTANINAFGQNSQADTLVGNSGANYLDGKAGNDVLFGGLGNDYLVGGAGADIFVFNMDVQAGGFDVISDFTAGADAIGLPSYLAGNIFVFDTAYGVGIAYAVGGSFYQILVSNTHNVAQVTAGIYYADF
jgi:trimeric autotransporter adhesin